MNEAKSSNSWMKKVSIRKLTSEGKVGDLAALCAAKSPTKPRILGLVLCSMQKLAKRKNAGMADAMNYWIGI
ncbi:MAG: hypothetical protein A2X25_01065 [Chloroflexi bacterium GWB2_49_20]|nr:MAG: hypothetical protein A2X25_01065 [Chloroflexi bacterium GWB2_49_20]OGN76823.1 MAG: hypothetical protein A2X26_08850 [Chloroflexi bacterium GWC2_49_37]HCC78277.1 hypothetical protein [Anaerolineae bacterium]